MRTTNDPPAPKEIAIPAETVKLLLAGALNELGDIAASAEQLTESREETEINKLPATFERLDDFRLLFAAVRSTEEHNRPSLTIDVDKHGDTLRTVIGGELTAHRALLDVDPSVDGAEQQREKAQRSIELLQAALDDVTRHGGGTQEAQQE